MRGRSNAARRDAAAAECRRSLATGCYAPQAGEPHTNDTHAKDVHAMKAIRVYQFGGPEVLKLEEVPDPRPTPGHVLVRVRAAGVNPAETYIRAGVYASLPVLPYTPGTDAAGTVEAVGEGVTHVEPGDRVWVFAQTSSNGSTG